MKRRSLLHLFWTVPFALLLRNKISLAPKPEPLPEPMLESLPEPPPKSGSGPVHECVDRPELPCPACAKWTGDPLAIKGTTLFRRRVS
jgi:hypothetical protein